MKKKDFLILLILIGLGAFLRFYHMRELSTFRGDQAIELTSTLGILRGDMTLIGIKTSISEVHNGAVMYYMLAPFLYLLRFDPLAGGVLQSLLSLGAVATTYILARRYFPPRTAALAGFLIATSALLVNYSRQTLLAFYPLFFTGVSLFLAVLLTERFRLRLAVCLGFLLGFMLQVHYSSLAVVFLALILPWLLRKHISKYYICLSMGFVIGLLPILVFELRHEFFNSKMLINLFFSHKAGPTGSFSQISYWVSAIADLNFAGSKTAGALFILVLGSSVIYFWKKITRLEKVCLAQLLATVIFGLIFVRAFVTHYAITTFVPLAILTASFIVRWMAKAKISQAVIYLFMIGFFILNYSKYGLDKLTGWDMAPGWSLPGVENASQLITRDVATLQGKTFNVAMLVDGESRGLPLRYFLEIARVSPASEEKYGVNQVLYIVIGSEDVRKTTLWEVTTLGDFVIQKTWPIQNGYQLLRLDKKI